MYCSPWSTAHLDISQAHQLAACRRLHYVCDARCNASWISELFVAQQFWNLLRHCFCLFPFPASVSPGCPHTCVSSYMCAGLSVFPLYPLTSVSIASCPSGLLCIDIIYSVQIQARPDRLPSCLLCLWEDTFLAYLLTEGKALGVPGFIYEMRFYQPYFSKHNPHFTVCACVKSVISSYHIHVWKYQREPHIMCNYIVLVFF